MSEVDKFDISNTDLFGTTIAEYGDCIIYFDNGESCKWSDENWPMAVSTHYSRYGKNG